VVAAEDIEATIPTLVAEVEAEVVRAHRRVLSCDTSHRAGNMSWAMQRTTPGIEAQVLESSRMNITANSLGLMGSVGRGASSFLAQRESWR